MLRSWLHGCMLVAGWGCLGVQPDVGSWAAGCMCTCFLPRGHMVDYRRNFCGAAGGVPVLGQGWAGGLSPVRQMKGVAFGEHLNF